LTALPTSPLLLASWATVIYLLEYVFFFATVFLFRSHQFDPELGAPGTVTDGSLVDRKWHRWKFQLSILKNMPFLAFGASSLSKPQKGPNLPDLT